MALSHNLGEMKEMMKNQTLEGQKSDFKSGSILSFQGATLKVNELQSF